MKGWGKERERLNERHENQKGGTRERGGGGGGERYVERDKERRWKPAREKDKLIKSKTDGDSETEKRVRERERG